MFVEWVPVFVAFSGNGKSVYDKTVHYDIPAKYGHTSRLNHLRSGFIDNWTNVKKVSKTKYILKQDLVDK